ncbi:uncharacterized protein BO66DRAFT_197692 [Aspergillus aculeatinus CBS 121060]|uniref:Uncharacterized protein n=1 Tax=Aspergillus aculeatinus CBS 121060 TaxID=1448322 RepID=A0ACD1GWS0_9EURO|nr:hypothetical protein BO66DRAFT_197692 [Aspergillus aculeatinus CBS 121060]RAH65800.1 hypothetical protein BO66DRAFT_197692 [Aspergillus aculeatinus CBS 121060]
MHVPNDSCAALTCLKSCMVLYFSLPSNSFIHASHSLNQWINQSMDPTKPPAPAPAPAPAPRPSSSTSSSSSSKEKANKQASKQASKKEKRKSTDDHPPTQSASQINNFYYYLHTRTRIKRSLLPPHRLYHPTTQQSLIDP